MRLEENAVFPMSIWLAYTAACLLLVIAPGPDNLLAVARGLGFFVLAFIPQFVDPQRGSVSVQMLVYGVWFAALTAVGFALMGVFATALSRCLRQRPRLVNGLNVGAGLTFVASGVSIAALSQK